MEFYKSPIKTFRHSLLPFFFRSYSISILDFYSWLILHCFIIFVMNSLSCWVTTGLPYLRSSLDKLSILFFIFLSASSSLVVQYLIHLLELALSRIFLFPLCFSMRLTSIGTIVADKETILPRYPFFRFLFVVDKNSFWFIQIFFLSILF